MFGSSMLNACGGFGVLELTMTQQSSTTTLSTYIAANNPDNLETIEITNTLTQPKIITGDLSGLDVTLINSGEIQANAASGTGFEATSTIKLTNTGWIRGAGGNGGSGGTGGLIIGTLVRHTIQDGNINQTVHRGLALRQHDGESVYGHGTGAITGQNCYPEYGVIGDDKATDRWRSTDTCLMYIAEAKIEWVSSTSNLVDVTPWDDGGSGGGGGAGQRYGVSAGSGATGSNGGQYATNKGGDGGNGGAWAVAGGTGGTGASGGTSGSSGGAAGKSITGTSFLTGDSTQGNLTGSTTT